MPARQEQQIGRRVVAPRATRISNRPGVPAFAYASQAGVTGKATAITEDCHGED